MEKIFVSYDIMETKTDQTKARNKALFALCKRGMTTMPEVVAKKKVKYIQETDWFKAVHEKVVKALDKQYHDNIDNAIIKAIGVG